MRHFISNLAVFGALLGTMQLTACGDDTVDTNGEPETDGGSLPCVVDDAGEPIALVDSGTTHVDAGPPCEVPPDSGLPDGGPELDDAGALDAGPDPFSLSALETVVLSTLSPMPAVPDDTTNAFADDANAAELGQAFFFDERFSGAIVTASGNDLGAMGETGKISCRSCHNGPFMDDQRTPLPRKVSLGANFHTRNAPAAVNSVFYTWTNWGGRFSAPWELPIAVVESGVIMNGSRLQVAHVIYDHYKTEYEAVFGALDPVIDSLPATGKPKAPTGPDGNWELMLDDPQRTLVNRVLINFGKALEAYQRLLISDNAPFDQYAAGDDDALSEDAKLGLRLFIGKARCVNCHNGPLFTDNQFHNLGVPQPAAPGVIDDGRFKDMPGLHGSAFSSATSASDDTTTGRLAGVTNPPPADTKGRFRTPGLRGVAQTAPYTHAGELATLEDVIEFYDEGGATPASGTLDPLLLPLFLSRAEKQQLLAFLESLSGESIPTDLVTDTAPP
jgi:cytochrome c peroxidase